jgi:hypothetical protein
MGSKIFLPEKMAILMLLLVAKVDGYIGFREKAIRSFMYRRHCRHLSNTTAHLYLIEALQHFNL